MLNVSVSTVVFGGGAIESPLPKVQLRLVSQRLSAREIIAQAVKEQVKALLLEHEKDFQQIQRQLQRQYLEQADVNRQAQQGKVALEREKNTAPQEEREIERALRAFRHGSYKMFVDGEEVVDLDEMCTLKEGAAVRFVRLIPLVGG
ncbi:MAG: hypothetical protein V2J55_04695 [Candidatus Competibacteraceae bacterium]|nr:hypothetical protein [Candidatus Competibacteraceae bacterium]